MTNGPMLFLDVDGKQPGAELHLGGPSEVQVTARATSQLPMSGIEIVVNGDVVASSKPSRDGKQAEIVKKIHLPQSSGLRRACPAKAPACSE